MIAFARSRFAAVCIGSTAALLAGCGGSPPPAGVTTAMPQAPAPVTHADRGSQPPTAPAPIEAPCTYLLSTTEASNLSDTHIWGPNCDFYINDTANMSYSTITAAKILYAGQAPNEIGATFPGATPAPGPTVNDPCPTIRSCRYLRNHPPATSGCSSGFFTGSGQTIGSPGEVLCFSRLTISGENETVCGLIEITGSQLHLNNSSIISCSSGVTFAMSSNTDDTNFSSSTLTLSAPVKGKLKGMLFYRTPSQSASVNFSSCTCSFTGILYFPTAPVSYSSAAGNYLLLIFGQANVSTSEGIRFGPP